MQQADIGLVGLGVMGQNLALNMCDHGYTVAVYNRTIEKTRAFVASAPAAGKSLIPCDTPDAFVACIRKPAPILLMVKAGSAVDATMETLFPYLAPDDILIDGGNSHFSDTIRRTRELKERDLHFVGAGISGGEEGARRGPAIMPGGSPEAYARIAPILLDISAKVDGQACCIHIGSDGAGHFVKMVHNGIEYADMQLIAEAYFLMKKLLGMTPLAMRDVFAQWNAGDLDSFLMEVTAQVLGKSDPETGQPMVDVILDRAGQKGTGQWTAQSSLELGSPASAITEAVYARMLSALKAERVDASDLLAGPEAAYAGDRQQLLSAIHDALYASKIVAYAQGFALMRDAARAHGWTLDLGGISMIWRGGCIIRAHFLQHIRDAYQRNPELPNLMLDPFFREILANAQDGWRRVCMEAVRCGVSAPAFLSSLAYYDGYRTDVLGANLIQAQRDCFGAHTYERIDRAGVFHSDWSALPDTDP